MYKSTGHDPQCKCGTKAMS